MKRIIRICFALLLWSLLIEIVFTACSKTVTPPPPVIDSPYKDYKFKVLEYLTNEPIKDVQLQIISQCFIVYGSGTCPPDQILATGYTDEHGIIVVPGQDMLVPYKHKTFSKEGYWTRTDLDEIIYGPTQDSCVLRLFAYGYLAVHLKNQSVIGPTQRLELHFVPVFDSLPTMPTPEQYFDHQASGFDSTLVFSTFGNVKSKIELQLESLAHEWPVVYSESRFVQKNDTLHWEITY